MTDQNDLIADTSWMREAFMGVQEELVLKLKQASRSISHNGVKGAVNEDHWIDVFRAYLPMRYEVASGFVIDSLGGRSEQIDVVIFDKHFTPTLLGQQSHRYIPAEAVYAVFECKPHFDKNYFEYSGQKAASVRRLKRTSVTVTHAGGNFQPRPPFHIISGIVAAKSSWADGLGESFQSNLPEGGEQQLDCGCALDDGAFDFFDGELKLFPAEGGLILFLFRLLAKLQSMGSVPAIDWAAYTKILTIDNGASEVVADVR